MVQATPSGNTSNALGVNSVVLLLESRLLLADRILAGPLLPRVRQLADLFDVHIPYPGYTRVLRVYYVCNTCYTAARRGERVLK